VSPEKQDTREVTPWPPPWARGVAFMTGIGLMVFEAVVDQSQHVAVYGVAFMLTGLPLARGLDKLLDVIGSRGK